MSRMFPKQPRPSKDYRSIRNIALWFAAGLSLVAIACFRHLVVVFLLYLNGEYIAQWHYMITFAAAAFGPFAALFALGAFREAYLAHKAMPRPIARRKRVKTKRA